MGIITSFDHNSDNPKDIERLGGYRFPVLETKGEPFRIRTFDVGNNDLPDLLKAARSASMLSFTKAGQSGAHLTTVDAPFKLADLGVRLSAPDANGVAQPISLQLVFDTLTQLKSADWRYGAFEIVSAVRESRHPTRLPKAQYYSESIVDLATQGKDAQGNKLFKRASTVTRAFRRFVRRDHFTVWVVDGVDDLLEGFGYVNPLILAEANVSVKMPDSVPILSRARVIKALDRLPISNARVIGRLIDFETGLPLDGHIKAQLAPSGTMPPGVDFVVPREAIKHELGPTENCDWAVAGLEPQGPKALFGDRQTINNHPFLISRPALRGELQDDAEIAFKNLSEGLLMQNVEILTADEFDAPFSWNRETYNRMLRWNANAWAAYGMDYRLSPWLTKRLALQWSQTLGWSDRAQRDRRSEQTWRRTLRIPIRCALRIQGISEASHNLVEDLVYAGQEDRPPRFEVPSGTMRQSPILPVMVVNDTDYLNILVPSHGGCDQDDFFLVLQRTIPEERLAEFPGSPQKYVVFRNPNARGEFSVWNVHPEDEVWKHETSKGQIVTFPKITRKKWPTQVLKALASGETEYIALPSEDDPVNMTAEDDRDAVGLEQVRILEGLKEDNIPVDALLATRLGRAAADLPKTRDSVFTDSKTTMAKVLAEYLNRVDEYVADLEMPKFVEELGRNPLLPKARAALRSARRQMFIAQNSGGDMTAMTAAEGRTLMRFVDRYGDNAAYRAQAVMALWFACFTTARSTGGYSDQPMFGTDVFRCDPLGPGTGSMTRLYFPWIGGDAWIPIWSRWPLLDALVYLGIARPPERPVDWDETDLVLQKTLIAAGKMEAPEPVPEPFRPYHRYAGRKRWNVACPSCGRGYLGIDLPGLVSFHDNKGVCPTCRKEHAAETRTLALASGEPLTAVATSATTEAEPPEGNRPE